jgi:MarR family transcriptional regulator for hemolysin
LSRILKTAFNQQVVAHGLTYARSLVLFHLSRKPDQTQTSLAQDLELERATLVHLLDRMEESRLIERRADQTDRRVRRISITAHGREQARVVASIAAEVSRQAFHGIDIADLTAGLDLMKRISANVGNIAAPDIVRRAAD